MGYVITYPTDKKVVREFQLKKDAVKWAKDIAKNMGPRYIVEHHGDTWGDSQCLYHVLFKNGRLRGQIQVIKVTV